MAHILVVDDDPDIGNLLEELLTRSGHTVTRAYSGTEALLVLKTSSALDLVLLDLMLPGLSGEAVLEQTKNIPVIVLSAKGETQDKVSLLRAGANDYITKPFDPDELLARLEVQLRLPTRSASRLAWGPLTYDLAERSAKVDGSPVHLTPTEDALLRILLEHPGQILTKSALLNHLMPISEDGTEQSLKQHMSNLRRKLREAGAADCIEAIRGIGFRLKNQCAHQS